MQWFGLFSICLLSFVISFFMGTSRELPDTADLAQKANDKSFINEASKKVDIEKSVKALKKEMPKTAFKKIEPAKIQKRRSEEEVAKKVEELKKTPRYQKLSQALGTNDPNNPVLNALIGLEEVNVVDHDTFIKMKDKLDHYLKNSPEEAFTQISGAIAHDEIRDDHFLRGHLYSTLAFIPGKADQVISMTTEELENNVLPVEKEQTIAPGSKTRAPASDIQEKVFTATSAYKAYLASAIKTNQDVDDKSFEILEKQKNVALRRNIAATYDRLLKPTNRNEILKKLKEKGINIFPDWAQVKERQ